MIPETSLVNFNLLSRLAGGLAAAGEIPLAVRALESGESFRQVESALESVGEVLRPRDFDRLRLEWEAFRDLVTTPSGRAEAIPLLWRRSPEEEVLRSFRDQVLPKIERNLFGSPLRSKDREWAVPFFPLPQDSLFDARYASHSLWDEQLSPERIFGGPAFREYLIRRKIRPETIERIVIDHNLDRGGSKVCYKLTIHRKDGRSVRVALRVVASRFAGFVPEIRFESILLRELARSPVSHLIPKDNGSAVIRISEDPPLYYLVFFGEWIEGESLLEVVNRDRQEGRHLASRAMASYADAVRRAPLFVYADTPPIDIKIRRDRRGRPHPVFFDFGTSASDPYVYVKEIYRNYSWRDRLLTPEETTALLYGIPVFRTEIDLRLSHFRQGRLLTNLVGYWSAEDERMEIEMLDRLSRRV